MAKRISTHISISDNTKTFDLACGKGAVGTDVLGGPAEMLRRYERITLQSFKGNGAAAQFYTRHGWQIAGQGEMPETGAAMVQYEKLRE